MTFPPSKIKTNARGSSTYYVCKKKLVGGVGLHSKMLADAYVVKGGWVKKPNAYGCLGLSWMVCLKYLARAEVHTT